MSLKKASLFFLLFNYLLFTEGGPAYATSSNQNGYLEILTPETTIIHEPANFTFPANFVPATGILPTFAVLDPAVYDSTLQIYDSNDASGFSVTMAITDLNSTTGSGKTVHYANIALASISQSPEGVDSGTFNNPPGAPNMSVPLKCPWDPQGADFQTQCNSYLTVFPEPPAGSAILANNLNTTDTTIDVQDASQLILPAPGNSADIIIGSDIISYTGISGNQLTGAGGIDVPHDTGATVSQYWDASDQLTLMQDDIVSDTGSYSVGFGFRLNITPEMRQDYYNGTIIFTLIPI